MRCQYAGQLPVDRGVWATGSNNSGWQDQKKPRPGNGRALKRWDRLRALEHLVNVQRVFPSNGPPRPFPLYLEIVL